MTTSAQGPGGLRPGRRPRRSRWPAGLALLAVCACGPGEGEPGETASARGSTAAGRAGEALVDRVLLVTVDTLRADALGAYGGPATPAIDALAERSLVFERAYTPATITHPSLSSMLTGLFPLRHGVNAQSGQLLDGVVPLGELLRARGVETASFVANLCKLQEQERTVFSAGWDLAVCGMDLEIDQHHWDRAVVDAAIEWIGARGADADPWFAWVHLMDPHAEHRPPESQWDYAARPVQAKLDQYQEFGAYEEQRVMPPPQRQRDLLDLYAAEVQGVDAVLGELLAAVDGRADRDSIAVVFSADHGEELFETWSRYDHGLSLTEGVLWVPLLVQAPGLEPRRTAEPVELGQVTPTVLELFGLPAPYELDGPSLLAPAPSRGFASIAITARDGEHRYWWRRGEQAYRRPPDVAPWRADAPWFLEKECLARYPGPSATSLEWLEPTGAAHARLRDATRAWLAGLGQLRQSTRIEDPELLEQLRALGYLGDE